MVDGEHLLRELGPAGYRLIVCPACSHTRSRANQKTKVMSVTRTEDGAGCIYNCHHCPESGAYWPKGSEPKRAFTKKRPQKTINQSDLWKQRSAAFGK